MSAKPGGERPAPEVIQRLYADLAEAAPHLGMTAGALRKRCTRGARREGRMIVARLGDLVAVKFGRSWRVRWPPSGSAQ